MVEKVQSHWPNLFFLILLIWTSINYNNLNIISFNMNKKGVEVTFNWIFVVIAGSILLMFFVYFGWKQIGLFNTIGINEVVDNINNQIDSLSIGLSLNKVVTLPNDIVFQFKCGNILYKTENKDTHNLIYGEGNFKDKFNLWTRAWIFPFKIDNLYYASNVEKRFFILGNENLFFNLPDKFRKFNSLSQVNKDDVIIDFTNSNYQNTYKENKVLVVDKDKNTITFYPGKQKEEFYGEEILIGAMFTNYEDYKCLKTKSLNKLGLISDLYKKKAELLKINSKCSFQYNELEKTLDLFKKDPLRYKNAIIEQNYQIKRDGCVNVF